MGPSPYDPFYENPFLTLSLPSRGYLLERGLWPDQIDAHVAACRAQIAERNEWLAGKPPGTLARRLAEDRYYDEHYDPVRASFAPSDIPAGITQRQHFETLPHLLRQLSVEILRATGQHPTCAIAGPDIASIIEFGLEVFLKDQPPIQRVWRGKLGQFFDTTDLHVEPECRAPYLLPRGELWLMLAWRYDDPVEQKTQWARPVGVLRFEGYTDPDMVHIAKCAR